jgi:hypothetical protein
MKTLQVKQPTKLMEQVSRKAAKTKHVTAAERQDT